MASGLVTGANRGIGLALCRLLQARGDSVIAVCRTPSAELQALGVLLSRVAGLVEGVGPAAPPCHGSAAAIGPRDCLAALQYLLTLAPTMALRPRRRIAAGGTQAR